MNSQLESISKVWPSIKSIFSVPHSEDEYQALVNTLDSLVDEVGNDQDHELAPVMETIGNLIETYENQAHQPYATSHQHHDQAANHLQPDGEL